MSDSSVTRLERFASTRYGIFTPDEAARHEVTSRMVERRVESGRWDRVLPGVYRVAAVPKRFRQRALAATLWSGGHISHESAARLWGLEGRATSEIHVTVGRKRGARHSDVVVHRTDDLIAADLSSTHGIDVTSPLRTVLDLAATLDPLTLELAIEDCLRRGLFTVGQLRWRIGGRCGMGVVGSDAIRQLLHKHLGDTDSGWELRVARILTDAGLPEPERQMEIATIDGTKTVDLGYPGSHPVALEYDSDRWHSGVQQRHRDAARRNVLGSAGPPSSRSPPTSSPIRSASPTSCRQRSLLLVQ